MQECSVVSVRVLGVLFKLVLCCWIIMELVGHWLVNWKNVLNLSSPGSRVNRLNNIVNDIDKQATKYIYLAELKGCWTELNWTVTGLWRALSLTKLLFPLPTTFPSWVSPSKIQTLRSWCNLKPDKRYRGPRINMKNAQRWCKICCIGLFI